MPIRLTVNGEPREYAGDPEMPLLWYLRDEAKLKGTKFGCGVGECRACTVHIDGDAATAVGPLMEPARLSRTSSGTWLIDEYGV